MSILPAHRSAAGPPEDRDRATPGRDGSGQDASADDENAVARQVASLTETLRTGDVGARQRSAEELAVYGSAAKAALPALIEALRDEDTIIEAAYAVGRIGPEAADAVPALVPWLDDERGWVRREIARVLGEIGPAAEAAVPRLREIIDTQKEEERAAAAAALARIKAAELERAARAHDERIRRAVAEALGAVPPVTSEAEAALHRLLEDDRAEVRLRAVRALVLMEEAREHAGPQASEARASLRRLLDDEDALVRFHAAKALVLAGHDAEGVLPALVTALRFEDAGPRRSALRLLAEMGPAARSTAPELVKLLLHEDHQTRDFAEDALVSIGEPSIPHLIGALRDRQLREDGWVSSAFERIGQPAIPHLAALLGDEDSDVGMSVAFGLADIGADAAPALIDALTRGNERAVNYADTALRLMEPLPAAIRENLAEMLRTNEDSKRRARAASLLAKFGPSSADVLLQALKSDGSDGVRAAAAYALGSAGPDSEGVVPALVMALGGENGKVRGAAFHALLSVVGKASTGFEGLYDLLEDKREHVRFRAAVVLARSRGDGARAIPVLAAALRSHDWQDSGIAADSLACIGEKAIPALLAVARSKGPGVRRAFMTLRAMGPDAKAAVPALVEMMKHGEGLRPYEVIRVLQGMGAAAAEATPALEEMELHEAEHVRNAAGEALRAIEAAVEAERALER